MIAMWAFGVNGGAWKPWIDWRMRGFLREALYPFDGCQTEDWAWGRADVFVDGEVRGAMLVIWSATASGEEEIVPVKWLCGSGLLVAFSVV